MARPLVRRDFIQLLIVTAIGVGAGQILLRSAPLGRDVGTNPTAQALLRDRRAPSQAVENSSLTLVVFTDFQCPACKRANAAMDAAVAEDGRVRVVYIDWPIFGPLSERAARVAIAADRQGIYVPVHRRLMTERRRLDDTVLRQAVERSGGNWNKVLLDLQSHGAAIDRQLARNGNDAYALGIAGTPTYLAGPLLVIGGLDEAGFAKAFALGRSNAT